MKISAVAYQILCYIDRTLNKARYSVEVYYPNVRRGNGVVGDTGSERPLSNLVFFLEEIQNFRWNFSLIDQDDLLLRDVQVRRMENAVNDHERV
jgi:hypothetical protein